MLNGIQEFCQSRQEEGNSGIYLTDYLSEVSLLSDVDTDDSEHRVTLMTIHSAKGLEFNTVFVVGLEENLFPCQMASGSEREMEEERRLFYVAITRAECHCFLSYAKSRLRYGKMEFGNPSRFLTDIDQQYLDFQPSIRSSRRGGQDDVELPWSRKASSWGSPSSSFGGSSSSFGGASSSFGGSSSVFAGQSSSWGSKPAYHAASSQSVRQQPPAGFKRVSRHGKPQTPTHPQPSSPSSVATPTASQHQLQPGKHIEHERFGLGLVEKVDGTGDSMKATVSFKNAGTKQLLLKFARFKIID